MKAEVKKRVQKTFSGAFIIQNRELRLALTYEWVRFTDKKKTIQISDHIYDFSTLALQCDEQFSGNVICRKICTSTSLGMEIKHEAFGAWWNDAPQERCNRKKVIALSSTVLLIMFVSRKSDVVKWSDRIRVSWKDQTRPDAKVRLRHITTTITITTISLIQQH